MITSLASLSACHAFSSSISSCGLASLISISLFICHIARHKIPQVSFRKRLRSLELGEGDREISRESRQDPSSSGVPSEVGLQTAHLLPLMLAECRGRSELASWQAYPAGYDNGRSKRGDVSTREKLDLASKELQTLGQHTLARRETSIPRALYAIRCSSSGMVIGPICPPPRHVSHCVPRKTEKWDFPRE